MSVKLNLSFASTASLEGASAIQLKLAGDQPASGAALADPQAIGTRAAGIAKFTGKAMATLDVLAPQGSAADRLSVIGLGKAAKLTAYDWLRAGGVAAASLKGSTKAVVFLDVPGLTVTPQQAADFALGMLLRAYSFTDVHPVRDLAYYRLHQVDLDGSETWSNVVAVAPTGNEPTSAVTVTPNPGSGLFELWTEAAAGTPLLVTVHSVLGAEVLQQRLTTGSVRPQLDLRRLPAGIYYVRVSTPGGLQTVRVVKH